MRHPPYHLRPNKVIDRSLLIELLNLLQGEIDLKGYTYYGFGGPFLEDFRLMAQEFPAMPLVSIEKDSHTYKRQLFHRLSKHLQLKHTDFRSFLATYTSNTRSVFWLDYTDLSYGRLDELMQLLTRVGVGSIIKITLRAESDDWTVRTPPGILGEKTLEALQIQALAAFQTEFAKVLPAPADSSRFRPNTFPPLVQDMVQIATQRALPTGGGAVFQPLSSCVYRDQTQMLSIAGIVCRTVDAQRIRRRCRNWPFANLNWAEPHRIDVPLLSIKERLLLERHLPTKARTGKALLRILGYNIDNGGPETLRKLQQYGDFYLKYPQFARVVI